MNAGSNRPDRVYQRGEHAYALFEEPGLQWLVYEGPTFLGVLIGLQVDQGANVFGYTIREAGLAQPDDRVFSAWRHAADALILAVQQRGE